MLLIAGMLGLVAVGSIAMAASIPLEEESFDSPEQIVEPAEPARGEEDDMVNGNDSNTPDGAADPGLAPETGDLPVVWSDWMSDGPDSVLADFDPDEDLLVMVCDLNDGDDPDVTVKKDPDSPGDRMVCLNGHVIARVADADGLTPNHVLLVDRADSGMFALLPAETPQSAVA